MDKKIDESTIEIENIIPEQTVTTRYDIKGLLRKKTFLENQLTDVNDLISRAEKLGITEVATIDEIIP